MGQRTSRLKVKIINLDVWKWGGAVLHGGCSADYAAWVKRVLNETIEPNEGACGHAFMASDKPWSLWVQDIGNAAPLAHEALHITAGLLDARGMKFTEASEEAYTYTMEYIITKTLERGGWSNAR